MRLSEKNNRSSGSEFNNRMAFALIEKCALIVRLRLFGPSLVMCGCRVFADIRSITVNVRLSYGCDYTLHH